MNNYIYKTAFIEMQEFQGNIDLMQVYYNH